MPKPNPAPWSNPPTTALTWSTILMAVALYCCGPRRSREIVRPERAETPPCGLGAGAGGAALSPAAALSFAPDLFAALSVALFASSFAFGPSFNLDGTMTGKLPAVEGDFGGATFREVEFEEATFLGEVEFETSAAMPDDWPNMSAVAAAVKSRAAAANSKRVRR